MDANQLVEGVARAVKAAEPASEFCLKYVDQSWWSCMTKAEWSGWMQAVFSVLAIGFALLAALLTHCLEVRRERARALQLADHVALRVRHTIALLQRSSEATLKLLSRAVEEPLGASEVDEFVNFLAEHTIDDASILALLPVGGGVGHCLNQAYSIFAECSYLLNLTKVVKPAGADQIKFGKRTHASMSNALAALDMAGKGIDKYLRSRGFTVAQLN